MLLYDTCSEAWQIESVAVTNLFIEEVSEQCVRFPILLLVDGHTSPINLAISEFCQHNDLILYCFPPHASP